MTLEEEERVYNEGFADGKRGGSVRPVVLNPSKAPMTVSMQQGSTGATQHIRHGHETAHFTMKHGGYGVAGPSVSVTVFAGTESIATPWGFFDKRSNTFKGT